MNDNKNHDGSLIRINKKPKPKVIYVKKKVSNINTNKKN